MSLLSADQQLALNNSIDKFFLDSYTLESRRTQVNSTLGYSAERWQRFAEFGWLAIPFAEEYGGLGGSYIDVAHLMRCIGSNLALEPYLTTVIMAGGLIAKGSNDQAKQKILAQIIAGECVATLAGSERNSAGSLTCIETRAELQGEHFHILGEKTVVPNAPQARYLIVSARLHGTSTDTDGIGLFLIDTQATDLQMTDYTTVDGHRAADIVLDLMLPPDSMIADAQLGHRLLEQAGNEGILLTSIEALGAMTVLLQTTLKYTTEREQFGVPLATFQVLKHRMADMFIAYHSAESLLLQCLDRLKAQALPTTEDMSALKAQIGKAGRLIGDNAIQLHGGMGMTDELDVGHYVKRLIALDALFGNTDYHLNNLSRTC